MPNASLRPIPVRLTRIVLNNPLYQTLLTVVPQPPPTAQRFIVLVPDHPVPEVPLARAVWQLAHPQQTPVLLVTLVADATKAWQARRRLATLAAMARDRHNPIETRLITGDWAKALRTLWRPGDVVVCHAEQQGTQWGKPHPLAEVFITRQHWPVYLLSGFYPKLNTSQKATWVHAALFDVVAAVILIGFLLFQMQLQKTDPLWLRQVLLAGSILLECGAIAFWHAYMFEDISDD